MKSKITITLSYPQYRIYKRDVEIYCCRAITPEEESNLRNGGNLVMLGEVDIQGDERVNSFLRLCKEGIVSGREEK